MWLFSSSSTTADNDASDDYYPQMKDEESTMENPQKSHSAMHDNVSDDDDGEVGENGTRLCRDNNGGNGMDTNGTTKEPTVANSNEVNLEDALHYLDQVKLEFGNRPHIYNEFLEIMKNFKAREVDTIWVMDRVRRLFHGYNHLILGFNTFLPEGYTMEMRDLEPVGVGPSLPGTNMTPGFKPPPGPIRGIIYFRPIQPCDRTVIQTLHEQWFPVDYKSDFFDTLCNINTSNNGNGEQQPQRRIMPGMNSLYCCVACFKELDDDEFEDRLRRQQVREERAASCSFWSSDTSVYGDEVDDDEDYGDDCILWEFDNSTIDDDGSTAENNGSRTDETIDDNMQSQSPQKATNITSDTKNDQVMESGESVFSIHHRTEKERMRRFYTNGFRFDDGSDNTTPCQSNGDIGNGSSNSSDNGNISTTQQNENTTINNTTNKGPYYNDFGERIIGCIVGSFLPSSLPSTKHRSTLDEKLGRDETASLLIPDCDTYTKMFYIMTLGTCREFRRCGLGSLLVNRVVEMIEKKKTSIKSRSCSNHQEEEEEEGLCGALYLHVITYNGGAMRLYERLGFTRVKEIQDYYTINSVNYDCYLYARYFHGNRGHQTTFDVLYGLASSIIRKLGYAFIPTT
mmetsp:Transcript_10718/g.23741  ORF Transcript_10718/g.23741 Transcript_10718/m.23741 type:complete len:625 (+) Transcript_10718:189-2063(+)